MFAIGVTVDAVEFRAHEVGHDFLHLGEQLAAGSADRLQELIDQMADLRLPVAKSS